MEIEVDRDGNFTHFVQGEPVLSYGGAQYDPPADADAGLLIARQGGELSIRGGHLYLRSEGHPVEFRNIEVMPLE